MEGGSGGQECIKEQKLSLTENKLQIGIKAHNYFQANHITMSKNILLTSYTE
jgi:hypothetical protein